MDLVNRIHDGLHKDNSPYTQPPNTMFDNQNGVITDLGEGNYVWTGMNDTKYVFELNDPTDKVLGATLIRERLFIIVLNQQSNIARILEAIYDSNNEFQSIELRWYGDNTELGLHIDYPLRSIIGFYENDDIQRIYFTDYRTQPKVINVKSSGQITLDAKFVNFFPTMDPAYGNIQLKSITGGGSLKAGVYLFAWRLFKEGYFSDWSYVSQPIPIMPNTVSYSYDRYQNQQGAAPDFVTSKKMTITINNLDTQYDSIQLCTFYSNDLNSVSSGTIVYDGDITGTEMDIEIIGNENFGSVTTKEIGETSVVIEKCKDIAVLKNIMTLPNIKEREELDLSYSNTENKNNKMDVTMKPIDRFILLDTREYPNEVLVTSKKALCGTLYAKDETDVINNGLLPNMWYYAETAVTFTDWDGPKNYNAGDVFQIGSQTRITSYTGTARLAIVKSKYKPASASSDRNTWKNDIFPVTTDYFNYKNPLFTKELKGYPGGEKVRLGILFFDLTGRPYFVRWLNNLTALYDNQTIGPGDFQMPERNPHLNYSIHTYSDLFGSAPDQWWKNVYGRVLGISISDIDITNIKDQISGFSIVRAPIERTHKGYGILNQMKKDGDNFYQYPTYTNYQNDIYHAEGFYEFLCPEDLFEMKGFSIDAGDKIVNVGYIDATYGSEQEYSYTEGFGREESTIQWCFYQKFIENTDYSNYPGNTNGLKNVENEILEVTKYQLGDDDGSGIPIDPINPVSLFRQKTAGFNDGSNTHYSMSTNLSILKLDIDESGNNPKGYYNLSSSTPRLLLCYVKKSSSTSYGGTGDSGLANTTYITTGHYQVINPTVLADIYDGSRYVFNEVEVFGGDTFINMFDFNRLLRDNDDADSDATHGYNHSIIVPIECRINLDLREGRHIAKDRSYRSVSGDTGLLRVTGNQRWEEYNYNDGYSTDNIDIYYLPIPYNFQNQSDFDMRVRHSAVKSYGELEDSFRKYSYDSFIDLEAQNGEINNIKPQKDYLIYWQRNSVGYIPVYERALQANQFGAPIQIATGDMFKRYDRIINMVGNSNQFGLVESNIGYHWYDSLRKLILTLTYNLKFDYDSLSKGLDNYLIKNIPDNMDKYDFSGVYPDYGVISGYDIRRKLVYITFRLPGEAFKTVAINLKNQGKFEGFFTFMPRLYFNYKDQIYAVADDKNTIYSIGSGDNYGTYFGTKNDMYFSIIVHDDTDIAKIFDNFIYTGSENTFTKITFETENGIVTEYLANNRNIKRRNEKYFGNIPRVDRVRLIGGYMKVTFFYDGTDKVTFNQLTTKVRKMM